MNLILDLFVTFLNIGLFSIGGGYATLPLIQQQAVVVHPWLTLQEFTDIITLSQMTPGPLAVNTSTFVGMRLGGLAGAIAATGGCVLCGILISLAPVSYTHLVTQTNRGMNCLIRAFQDVP